MVGMYARSGIDLAKAPALMGISSTDEFNPELIEELAQ